MFVSGWRDDTRWLMAAVNQLYSAVIKSRLHRRDAPPTSAVNTSSTGESPTCTVLDVQVKVT